MAKGMRKAAVAMLLKEEVADFIERPWLLEKSRRIGTLLRALGHMSCGLEVGFVVAEFVHGDAAEEGFDGGDFVAEDLAEPIEHFVSFR